MNAIGICALWIISIPLQKLRHAKVLQKLKPPNSAKKISHQIPLGLKDSQTITFCNLDEKSKLLATYHLLRKLRMRQTELRQDIIFHKFSAFYLPSLVDRFLMSPPLPAGSLSDSQLDFLLNNSYVEMMSAVSHTPYFAKYLRSRLSAADGGKMLIHALAERLLQVAPSWDRKMLSPPVSEDHEDGYFEGAAGTSIQLLSTLLAASQDSPVLLSQEAKPSLLPWLKKWERCYRNEFLELVCNRTRNLLEANPVMMKGAREIRRSLKNWNVCGNPVANPPQTSRFVADVKPFATAVQNTRRHIGSILKSLTKSYAIQPIFDFTFDSSWIHLIKILLNVSR